MKCEIQFNTLSLPEWEARFSKIKRSNLLQSYPYAQAACRVYKQTARWGLILIDGHDAGLIQILEAGFLWNFFHGVMIDRGPLWFDGFGGAAHLSCVLKELRRLFPRRFGRRVRFLPEIEDGSAAQGLMTQAGWQRKEDEPGYQTLWLDLRPDLKTLRAGLDRKWRNSLNRADKIGGIQLEWDCEGRFFPWLNKIYALDKSTRGYGGAAPQFMDVFAPFLTSRQDMMIGRAILDGRAVAAVMFVCHGQSATYHIGWNAPEGRKHFAHHVLLWAGLEKLKSRDIKDLDLGGINDTDEAAGLKKFKEGLGGQKTTLVGQYS